MSGQFLFLQAIAVASYGGDVAVAQEPVQDGRRHDRVPEDLAPLSDAAVAGQYDAASLVAPLDELEEQMRRVVFQRRIAQLIDDEKLWLGGVGQPLLQTSFRVSLRKGGGHDHRRGE